MNSLIRAAPPQPWLSSPAAQPPRIARFPCSGCMIAGCSVALGRLLQLDGMFLLYLVIFLAITTHSLWLRSILRIRDVLLRPAEWPPVWRFRPRYRLEAVSCEDGHRGVHQFGKTQRANPPCFGKNATNEPTVVRNQNNERTHRASARTLRTNPPPPRRTRRKCAERTQPPQTHERRKCAERTQTIEPPATPRNATKTKPFLANRLSELVSCQRDRTTGVSCETKLNTELGDRIMDAGRRQDAPNEPTGFGKNAPNEPTREGRRMEDGGNGTKCAKSRRTNSRRVEKR